MDNQVILMINHQEEKINLIIINLRIIEDIIKKIKYIRNK